MTWEKGDLVKKEPTPSAFFEHLQTCLKQWISHNYIRHIQGEAISKEKKFMQKASVLLHLDFAENWTVQLPDEIQSHHWSKSEVTIFTCVATTQKGAHSFAVVSDDICHDSAHACYTPWLRCTNGLKSTSQCTLILLMSVIVLLLISRTNFKFMN